MASCERCWRDAYDPHGRCTDVERYRALVASRICTPEEQAGREARTCAACKRRAVHEIVGQCMACGAMA